MGNFLGCYKGGMKARKKGEGKFTATWEKAQLVLNKNRQEDAVQKAAAEEEDAA